MSLAGDVKTNVSIEAHKSQQLIVIAAIGSVISLVVGFGFLWVEHPKSYAPFLCAAISGAIALGCWLKSHRNTDLSGGNPTQLRVTDNEMFVSVDPRNAFPATILQQFSSVLIATANCQALPLSSGEIDSDGNIIPGSEGRANEAIKVANAKAVRRASVLSKAFEGLAVTRVDSSKESHIVPSFTGNETNSFVEPN
jgi:hypothetical protein